MATPILGTSIWGWIHLPLFLFLHRCWTILGWNIMKRDVELLHEMVAPKNAIMVYCTHAHKLASLAIGKMILNHPESLWIGKGSLGPILSYFHTNFM